jgi:hypothetical protein
LTGARDRAPNLGMTAAAIDPADAPLLRAGAVSALLLGLGYLVIFPLYAKVGAPPSGGGELWLKYLAGKTSIWWAILWISVVTDLLFVPVGLALFVALRSINRSVMLIATACVLLFVALDLSITWSHYASLLTLSERYAAAATDRERATYIAAAEYASTVFGSRLFIVYAIGVLSSGILLVGVVMLRGVFNRVSAYLALATGVLGIASLSGWGVAIILNAVCATIWLLFAGAGLWRLGRT